ncbi:hypothetical protein J3R83DRAFT_8643 [Lanmaoa asiatica]|nr:hypothetical protein J3R83DRAFT_8643 [Lanmaoa asiatica]
MLGYRGPVGAVEAYIKGMSPIPFVRLPAAGLVLSEHKGSGTTVETAVPAGLGGSSVTWRVKRRDEQRTLIASQYDPTERAYTGSILLTTSTGGLSTSLSTIKADESVSRTGKAAVSSLGNAPDGLTSSRAELSSSPSTSSRRRTSSGSIRSPSSERIKSSSSAFTVKGELKHTTDLIVAEVVVDTKLYSEGYDVTITSTVREGTNFISLAPSSNEGSAGADPSSVPTTNASTLPISTSIYTVPASPLHSAGLNADRPPRHLLRLMLPTAQYQISTVQDPLTGETRGALPKPQWYMDLQEKGFSVQVDIRPLGNASGNGKKTVNGNDTKKNGGGVIAKVEGVVVGVASEKESLTALGRDELQDDRVSRMLLLQRSADEEDAFPDELKVPLGRSDHMLDDAVIVPAVDMSDDPKTQEEGSPQQEAADKPPALVSMFQRMLPETWVMVNIYYLSRQDSPENGGAAQTPAPTATSGGLLGFLNAYPNPLARWTTSAKNHTQTRPPSLASSRRSSGALPKVPGGLVEDETRGQETTSPVTKTTTMPTSPSSKMYPLSIILIVALIAFLIGSLLPVPPISCRLYLLL